MSSSSPSALDLEDDVLYPMPRRALSFAFFASSPP